MKLTRRGWNNFIIIGVLFFVAIIQLPELLKQRLLPETSSTTQSTAGLVRLLPPEARIAKLVLPDVIFSQQAGNWQSEPAINGDPTVIVSHWSGIAGTKVDADTFARLNDKLTTPRSVEVWLVDQAEPYRLTVYQLPQFWLLQNWAGEWLAITVEPGYLFPAT
ncbi:hypothetical protein [Photobacterium galatheae]|uniref:50S ribosomal protein L33 n=1 Tax=Photobacterium galatheae TaxID=1654360 RepID=A0A066RNM1_9GAMM|nr:hypothetical protein [Photobacterium galatheae]KDM90666.1 hypothetical protein EA58_16285 [Photobacterium galatheae]MCM0150638.1 hypothetical protein [Photobacterium galatheae]